MSERNFLAELKRRNVYKVAVAYVAVAWLIIQVATQIFPFFEIPNSVVRSIVLLLGLGFPIALTLAWAFEITPEGIARTGAAGTTPRRGGRRSRWWVLITVVAAIVAAGLFLLRLDWTETRSPAASVPVAKSIAVLPFENLSDNKENAYFANGVQDEILTHLARIADLKVISRTSVMQYQSGTPRNLREIGQQLGVAHLLEGSVQRAEGRVRVIAQLIDAQTDAHLWAQTYDRDLADVFTIQSEIAKAIAEQLRAKLSPPEKAAIEKVPTTDLAAYDLYLQAHAIFAHNTDLGAAEKGLPEAVRLLDDAVARDPQFLLAWCLLARIHGNMYAQGYDHTPARLEMAQAAVQSALRLQPDSGEAHLAQAAYYNYGFRDYARAREELAIARKVLPNNADVFEYTAYIDRRAGRWTEARQNLERALELDPRNFRMLQQMALIYEALARYAEEDQIYLRALAIKPGDPTTRLFRTEVQVLWRADIRPFQNLLAQMTAENPALAAELEDVTYAFCERTETALARTLRHYPAEGVVMNGVRYPRAYWEGAAARVLGKNAEAEAAFAVARAEVERTLAGQPESAAGLSLLSLIDAGLGRKEDAIRAGKRACEMTPISKDAISGVVYATGLAQVYAWVGEKELAIDQIAAVQRVPNYLGYGLLKLHPFWDSLRGEPRFDAILASLAPQD